MHTNLCATCLPSRADQQSLVVYKPRYLSAKRGLSTCSPRLTPLTAAVRIQHVSAIKSALKQHAGSSHATGTRSCARALSHPLFSRKDEADVLPLLSPREHRAMPARGLVELRISARAFPGAAVAHPAVATRGGRKVGHLGKGNSPWPGRRL